jgi:hypothetical protein
VEQEFSEVQMHDPACPDPVLSGILMYSIEEIPDVQKNPIILSVELARLDWEERNSPKYIEAVLSEGPDPLVPEPAV